MIFIKLIILIFYTIIGLNALKSVPFLSNLTNGDPLVLVPGDGGCRSYATLNYHVFSVTRLIWVNYEYMLFPGELTTAFKLIYDPKTHMTSDMPNSVITFPGWGSTETIEDLDEWKHQQTTYFAPFVQELTKDKYYVRNRTIRGAQYDFRKAPNENHFFVSDLKKLIEDTYIFAGNKRIVLLGHSLGSLYSLFFLQKMSLSWKKHYIRTFISVSAPLGGAVKAVKLETTGDALGSPRSPFYFRDMQRSFPSTTFLLPRPKIYGAKPIVITPSKNYSAYDFDSLFKDMGFPLGSQMYNDTRNLIDGSKTPEGIDELHCIHGYGLLTLEQLLFSSFPDKEPELISGDGDFTVNIQSLEVCKKWTNVNYYTLKDADHMAIVGHPEFINKIKQILYQEPNKHFPISSDYKGSKDKLIMRMF